MSQQFVITASINAQVDHAALARATQGIRAGLGGVNANVGVNTASAQAGLSRVAGGARAASTALKQVQAQAAAASATLQATVTVTGQGASALQHFSEQAGLAARRFVAFSVAAGSMVAVVRGIREGVKAAVEFELAMNKVEQVSTETGSTINKLRADIGSLATNLGVSSASLAETAITLKQAGLSVNQTRDALKALALTDLAPSFDSMKQSTEGLIAAFRQFNLQSSEFETTLGSMNAVAAQFAVESADLVTAVQKAGGAFKLTADDTKAGSEALNEFMGLFTAVRSTTRESADSIATGLRTIFTRFQRADTVKALQDLGINLRYTRQEAEQMGNVNLRDQFVGAYESVRRLSEGLAGLRETDPRYAQVIEQLGGYRQISRVIPLLQQFKTAEEAKNTAIAGGISLQIAAEKRQEALATKITKLKEEYLDLFRKVTQDKAFQALTGSLLAVASGFAKVIDAARPLLPLLLTLGTVKLFSNIGNIAGAFSKSLLAPPGAAIGRQQGALRFASGGYVPGSGNNDTEPALLMPGEFVLNKAAVSKLGVPALRDLNEGKARFELKRYATGSTDPVGGTFDDLRRRVDEQRAVFAQRLEASSEAADGYNRRQKSGYTSEAELEQLGEECDRLAADFRAARDELQQLTRAMYAAKGEVAPRLAVYHDDGRGNTRVLEEFRETDDNEYINRVARSRANEQFRGQTDIERFGPLGPDQLPALTATKAGRGSAPDERVYVGYAPGAAPGTPLPGAQAAPAAALQEVAIAAQAAAASLKVVGQVSVSGQDRLARLRASQPNSKVVDATPAGQTAAHVGQGGIEYAAQEARHNRVQRAEAISDALSPAEQARVRAAQQAEEQAARTGRRRSAIEAAGINQLPAEEQVRFYQQADRAVRSAKEYAVGVHGPAGEAAANSDELDDFVTEYFAKYGFQDIDPSRSPKEIAAFVRKSGKYAAQAFFSEQQATKGRFAPPSALGDTDVEGREADPSALAGGFAPVVEERQEAEARLSAEKQAQLEQVRRALGGKLPTTHQEYVDAARSLGVTAKTAYGATGAGVDSTTSITQVLAEAVRDRLGQATTAELAEQIQQGGLPADNPTSVAGGVVPSLAGVTDAPTQFTKVAKQAEVALAAQTRRRDGAVRSSGGRKPPKGPPAPPSTPDPEPDPFDEFRRRNPEAAAYQDEVLARLDARQVEAEVAKARRFEREMSQTKADEMSAVRVGRRQYATNTDPLSQTTEDRYPAGSEARERELYQLQQLARAKARYGDQYGVPGDVLSANRREGREEAARDIESYDIEQARRAENRAFVDPLEVARQTRRQRFEDGRAAQQRAGGEAAAREQEQADRVLRSLGAQRLDEARAEQVTGGLAAQRAGQAYTSVLASQSVFEEGKAGNRTLVGGIAAERAKQVADRRLADRGGVENLSQTTIDAVRAQAATEEEDQVRREFIDAQKRLLELLKPQMSAVERHTKALEDAAEVMTGQAEVARDKTGKILGKTEDVDALVQRTGQLPPGAGSTGFGVTSRASRFFNRAREFATNNQFTRLNARLGGFTNNRTSLAAAGAAAGAVGYFSNKVDEGAGSAEDAVRYGQTDSFLSTKGGVGAAQGALAGAAGGFALAGPLGAIVGGVGGAVYGFVSATKEAAQGIRQAKIDTAIQELSEKLSSFASGLPDDASSAAVAANIETYQREASDRAKDRATSFFSFRTSNFGFGAVDANEYLSGLNSDFRKEFGPQLPQIAQGLAKQADRIGRDGQGKSVDALLAELKDGAGGLNQRFIEMVAQLRGLPVQQVEQEFRKTLLGAQRQGVVERQSRDAKAGEAQQINSYVRLLQAVQSAADSLRGLQSQAQALTDVLDGTVNASRVSSGAEALDDGFGRFDRGALRPLSLVAAAGGDPGRSLLANGEAADSVARVLPGVLASVVGSRDLTEENLTTRASDAIYQNLGFARAQDAPQEVQRAINTVLAGLNDSQAHGRGVGGVLDEVKTDASKYAERLLAGSTDPLKDFGGKTARLLEEQANRFVDGLTALHARIQQVGQLYDQLAQTRAGNQRLAATFAAENAGRRNQAFDFLTVAQLEQGTTARQQRLTGVGDARAFDPRFLGQQLAVVRGQIGAAVERQQAAFQATGGRGPQFAQAAEEVLRLKDRAANLQQALKNLSDVAERNAVIQEKLNRLKEEEDGRLSVAERFFGASPEEQFRMQRGVQLAADAANRGNLDSYTGDERRLIIDTLRGFGGTTLTGFNGAPRADDLLRSLLSGSGGGVFRLTEGQQAERRGLQQEAVGRGAVGEEAIQQLIEHQQQGSTEFFRNLQEQHSQFISRLERTLLQVRRQDLQNERARAAATVTQLTERGQSRDVLAGVGVRSTAQLSALRGQRATLGEVRQQILTAQADTQRVDFALSGDRVRRFAPNAGGRDIVQWLGQSGLGGDQQMRVQNDVQKLLDSRRFQNALDTARRAPDGDARKAAIDAVYQRALTESLGFERDRSTTGATAEQRGRLGGIQDVNPDAVLRQLSGSQQQADAFFRALDAFNESDNRIEAFNGNLSTATAELARLEAELARLNTAVAVVPAAGTVARAGGGDIFRPMGTDTVPAMLTPGEYVVNAKSAAANAALLHHINSAKGSVQYRQTGGTIVRAGQQQAPTTSQVANGYLWAVDKIRAGMSWLGFADGGVVPQYLADGGSALGTFVAYNTTPPQDPRVLRREEQLRRMAEGARDRAANNTNTLGGNTATISAIPDDFARAFAEQARYDARRQAIERARQAREQAVAARRQDRARAGQFGAVYALEAGNFNRVALSQYGVRRPGDDGQRAIAARAAEGQNQFLDRRFQQDPALRAHLAARVARQQLGVARFAGGGVVGGAGSGDSVASLLTPGEGVLNQRAMRALGSNFVHRFNQGGVVGGVNYLATGGPVQGQSGGEAVQAVANLTSVLNSFVQAAGGFGQAAQSLTQTFNVFAGTAQALTQAISNMPRTLTVTGTHHVTVTFNGAEVLSKLTPEIQQMVTSGVREQLGRAMRDNFPEAGVTIN